MSNVILAAVFFFLGGFMTWQYQDVRYKGIMDAQTVKTQKEEKVKRDEIETKRQRLQTELERVNDEKTEALAQVDRTADVLSGCLVSGKCGVRVAATCPVSVTSVSTSANTASGDDAEKPELTASARQDYLSLRKGIAAMQEKLDWCQGWVNTITTAK